MTFRVVQIFQVFGPLVMLLDRPAADGQLENIVACCWCTFVVNVLWWSDRYHSDVGFAQVDK